MAHDRGFETLDMRIAEIGRELSGLAVVILRGGEVAHEAYFGRRFIDAEHPERDRPLDGSTKFRVASISKTATAIGAMVLADEGLLDLDRDISDYLGFRLRNPAWPDSPISASMLLSHTSSLRDCSGYSLALPHHLREFFSPGFESYEDGRHFASPSSGSDRSPGAYYCYANIGYGVLATAMEKVSGERFDRFMARRVLAPLGLDASYNVLSLSDEGFADLAALYRKGEGEESWDPSGPWRAQVDDYRGLRPASPCKLEEGLGPEALSRYELGSNGTLFSPQGGLRASALEVASIARLVMGEGALGETKIISRSAARRMMSLKWSYDPVSRNGDIEDGSTRATGLGLVRTTGTVDSYGGDSLLPDGGGPLAWGHHADAYGLLGGMLFSPETGFGLVYLIGGTPRDPSSYRGRHYSRTRWEEAIIEAAVETAIS
jgi:Beta-lactamase class C and other penicillin binding proteins